MKTNKTTHRPIKIAQPTYPSQSSRNVERLRIHLRICITETLTAERHTERKITIFRVHIKKMATKRSAISPENAYNFIPGAFMKKIFSETKGPEFSPTAKSAHFSRRFSPFAYYRAYTPRPPYYSWNKTAGKKWGKFRFSSFGKQRITRTIMREIRIRSYPSLWNCSRLNWRLFCCWTDISIVHKINDDRFMRSVKSFSKLHVWNSRR